MSKRHHVQPSQDLRAPPARGARAAGSRPAQPRASSSSSATGAPAAQADPLGLPRSAQSAHPLRARRLTDGRLRGRPSSHHRPAAPPADRRGTDPRPSPGPWRVPCRTPDEPARPGARRDRRRVHAGVLLARPAGPRLGDRARHRPARARAPAPRRHARPTSAPTSTGSAASRRSASRPSMRASGSCPTRSSCRRARRSRNRCWAVPTRAAGSSSCSSPSSSVRAAWPPASRTGRSLDRDRLDCRGAVPDHDHARHAEQARRRSTTGPGRSCWPRPSSVSASSAHPTS